MRPDGVAVYVAGPEDRPLGEPNLDNAAFLVIAADAHWQRGLPAARRRLFREWNPPLRRALDYVPRSPAGLVFNDPARPHSPYGFTDTVGKTGELFFERSCTGRPVGGWRTGANASKQRPPQPTCERVSG